MCAAGQEVLDDPVERPLLPRLGWSPLDNQLRALLCILLPVWLWYSAAEAGLWLRT